MIRIFEKAVLALALVGLTACGTTVEKQEARYKRALDALAAVATKNPKMKASIKEQRATFEAEYKKVMAGTDAEAKKTALARLNSRIEAFTKKVDPAAKAAATDKKKKATDKKAADKKKPADAKKATDKKVPVAAPSAPPSKLGAPEPTKLGAPPANKLGDTGAKVVPPANKLGGDTPKKLGAPPASAPTKKLGQ